MSASHFIDLHVRFFCPDWKTVEPLYHFILYQNKWTSTVFNNSNFDQLHYVNAISWTLTIIIVALDWLFEEKQMITYKGSKSWRVKNRAFPKYGFLQNFGFYMKEKPRLCVIQILGRKKVFMLLSRCLTLEDHWWSTASYFRLLSQ